MESDYIGLTPCFPLASCGISAKGCKLFMSGSPCAYVTVSTTNGCLEGRNEVVLHWTPEGGLQPRALWLGDGHALLACLWKSISLCSETILGTLIQ